MDSPEMIDKSKVIIMPHAVKKFFERSRIAHARLKKQGLSEKKIVEKLGAPVPPDPKAARASLTALFNMSDHHKASTSLERLNQIYKIIEAERMERLGGRPTGEPPAYYFRYQRWQFRVVRDRDNPENFIMITVVWLNDNKYGRIVN